VTTCRVISLTVGDVIKVYDHPPQLCLDRDGMRVKWMDLENGEIHALEYEVHTLQGLEWFIRATS